MTTVHINFATHFNLPNGTVLKFPGILYHATVGVAAKIILAGTTYVIVALPIDEFKAEGQLVRTYNVAQAS